MTLVSKTHQLIFVFSCFNFRHVAKDKRAAKRVWRRKRGGLLREYFPCLLEIISICANQKIYFFDAILEITDLKSSFSGHFYVESGNIPRILISGKKSQLYYYRIANNYPV